MADNLFTFMYWAIGNGLGAGEWPGNGNDLVTWRHAAFIGLYATRDERIVAACPLEEKFWDAFCRIIQLDPELRNDSRDVEATGRKVAENHRVAATLRNGRKRFAAEDCCCTVVATLQEALEDPHFNARGLFAHRLAGDGDVNLPALPMPISQKLPCRSRHPACCTASGC